MHSIIWYNCKAYLPKAVGSCPSILTKNVTYKAVKVGKYFAYYSAISTAP